MSPADPVPATERPAAVRPNALVWLWLSLFVLLLDQASKHYFLSVLDYGGPAIPVIEGFWEWKLAKNHGAAFSFLAAAGGWQRWFFSLLALAISGLLAYWLARLPRGHWREALPFALIIGGAIGNLVDRLRFGYVVDFIHWYWQAYSWPVFNLADSAIVAGAVSMVLFSLLPGGRR
ncbi:signal peptidase II [Silanimonas lenta]|uniref:signal peptidase II n=1 Tax=Silanimonas lenta TaxID=265429 RepID=UPI000413EE1A|nr:signal peptidase II [Silanimonas lenta]